MTDRSADHEAGASAAADGGPLHLDEVAPSGRPRAHLAVVHGFAEHGGRYRAFAEACAAHGVAVYLLDLPGHGRSPGVRGLVADAEGFVEHVITLLTRLNSANGPVAAYGHSLGGALVLRAAQRRPDLLDAVIAASPYLRTALSDPPWLLRLADAASRPFPKLRTKPIDAEVISSLPEEVRRYREDPLVDHGGVRLATVRELHAIGPRVLAEAASLVTPTLIVHGDADRLASIEGSRALVAGVASGEATLREIPGGAHDLLHDSDAERVRDGSIRWLRERIGLETIDRGGVRPRPSARRET